MKTSINRPIAALFLAFALAVPAFAQQPSPLPIPPQLEKDLSARASDVTEVTLGKNMLAFASKFMHDKDGDEANVRQLIEGLDGIYVREYEFDKDGQYSPDEIEQLRKFFQSPEWSPIVHEHERRSGETTDILVKTVNGESKGMFILSAEPRDLTIVLILGPIRPEDLGKLRGLAGLGALADLDRDDAREKMKDERTKEKDKLKENKEKDKEKTKDKKDPDQ